MIINLSVIQRLHLSTSFDIGNPNIYKIVRPTVKVSNFSRYHAYRALHVLSVCFLNSCYEFRFHLPLAVTDSSWTNVSFPPLKFSSSWCLSVMIGFPLSVFSFTRVLVCALYTFAKGNLEYDWHSVLIKTS